MQCDCKIPNHHHKYCQEVTNSNNNMGEIVLQKMCIWLLDSTRMHQFNAYISKFARGGHASRPSPPKKGVALPCPHPRQSGPLPFPEDLGMALIMNLLISSRLSPEIFFL